MATISIRPVEGNYQIEVRIEIQFETTELGKEYLLKGSVKVFEGRQNLLSTLELNEAKLAPANTNLIRLSQQFSMPHHGFQLRFETEHTLYVKV